MFHVPNKYRVKTGAMASDDSYGNNGYFAFRSGDSVFNIIATDGKAVEKEGLEVWEHVSVHVVRANKQFTPTWDDMCKVKELFWDDTDCVVQFHPPKSEYVNRHQNVLHLWRPANENIPTPPKIFV